MGGKYNATCITQPECAQFQSDRFFRQHGQSVGLSGEEKRLAGF